MVTPYFSSSQQRHLKSHKYAVRHRSKATLLSSTLSLPCGGSLECGAAVIVFVFADFGGRPLRFLGGSGCANGAVSSWAVSTLSSPVGGCGAETVFVVTVFGSRPLPLLAFGGSGCANGVTSSFTDKFCKVIDAIRLRHS